MIIYSKELKINPGYIEREAAITAAFDAVELYRSDYEEIAQAINDVPSADVAPVRHGYWIENQPYTIKHKNVTMSGNAPQCSECGYISFGGFENKTRYCPNCGAKMDKEEA